MSFGEKIKFVREKLLLSQVNMAMELGVSPLAVIRWEQERTAPNFKSRKAFQDLCVRHGIKFEDE